MKQKNSRVIRINVVCPPCPLPKELKTAIGEVIDILDNSDLAPNQTTRDLETLAATLEWGGEAVKMVKGISLIYQALMGIEPS